MNEDETTVAVAQDTTTRVLRPLGWRWHSTRLSDPPGYEFIAYPTSALEAFNAAHPDRSWDDIRAWLGEHGVVCCTSDYAGGMAVLRAWAVQRYAAAAVREP